VSRTDPLAAEEEVPLAALAGRRILTIRRELAPQHLDATLRDLRRAGGAVRIEATLSTGNWGSPEMLADIAAGSYVAIGLASSKNRYTEIAVVPLADATPVPLTLTVRANESRPEVLALVELAQRVVDRT
jgi:hypothetical protein